MLQFRIDALTPTFEGMGVSPTDVATYVNNLSGYIYAILGTLVLAIVVIIAAQFVVKKGIRHLVAINACLAWVLIVTMFIGIDVAVAVVIIAIEAVMIVLYLKKRKAA